MWLDSPDDNEQNPNNRLTSPTNTSVGAGGGSGGVIGGGSSAPAGSNPSTVNPIQPSQPTQQFGNIQDYLKGNQQQGEALGQTFTENLANTATNEKSAIDTAANQAQNDINAGSTAFNSNLVNQAASNPTSVANNPNQLQSFLGQWNAAYTGPSSFEASTEYAPAVSAAQEASTTANELGTAGGQKQLLNSITGTTGEGNQNLDQAILQNSSYAPQIQNAASNFNSINNYLGQQASALDTQAQQAAANTAATQQQTQAAFANAPSTFQNNLNAKVTNAQNAAQQTGSQIQQDLVAGNPTAIATDLQKAGVDPSQIQNITSYLTSINKDYSGVTPTQGQSLAQNYSFNPNPAITPANVASSQDYANAQALQQLTGVDYSGILNPSNASQAGAPGNPNQINGSNISSYLNKQLNQQDTQLLANQPNIGQDVRNMGNPTLMANYAQKYVDALQRQGQLSANNPLIQSLYQQALSGFSQYANRPDIQAGFSAINKVLFPVLMKK